MTNKYQEKIGELLATADVQINGDRAWDMQVHNTELYGRILGQGSLGVGEAYICLLYTTPSPRDRG